MKILALNAGSNSLKFEIVEVEPGRLDAGSLNFGQTLLAGAYDDVGKQKSQFSLLKNKQPSFTENIEVRHHGQAAQHLLGWLQTGHGRDAGVNTLRDLDRIGQRVVHGADVFHDHALITDEVMQQTEKLRDLAPLHNASAIAVIDETRQQVGTGTIMIAVFDTIFHQSIPEEGALYPLPPAFAQSHGIKRYGFHGISHAYMMLRYQQMTGRSNEQTDIITMHLEGGSSIAAIKGGRSIDTSMGFTPLEGLMMGTRCGDIDPAVVTYLMRKEKMTAEDVEAFLNKECGLLGVSGFSGDTRELQKHPDHQLAQLALRMFSYRVRKYIGAYMAVLGGANALIFGGGIGENTPLVRKQICQELEWCGLVLDRRRNEETIDREGLISTDESSIPAYVIPTQEGRMMAKYVANWKAN